MRALFRLTLLEKLVRIACDVTSLRKTVLSVSSVCRPSVVKRGLLKVDAYGVDCMAARCCRSDAFHARILYLLEKENKKRHALLTMIVRVRLDDDLGNVSCEEVSQLLEFFNLDVVSKVLVFDKLDGNVEGGQ